MCFMSSPEFCLLLGPVYKFMKPEARGGKAVKPLNLD